VGLFVVTTKIPALAKQQFSVASCQRRQPQILRLGRRGDLAQEDKFMKEAGLALGTRNLKHKTRNWFPKLETGFQTLTGQRAILLRLSGSGGPTMVSDQPDKENRMKSQKLFVVALASLIVLALSLPVLAQSTTQSNTTTTTQNPPAAQSTTTMTSQDPASVPAPQVTQSTDTTVTPAGPEVKQTDSTTTTTTPQPKVTDTTTTTTTPAPVTDVTSTTTAPPPKVKQDTTSTTTVTPQPPQQ
jgi:hypothetical protein